MSVLTDFARRIITNTVQAVHLWVKNHFSDNEARAKRVNFDFLFEDAIAATKQPRRARSTWDVMRSDPALHPPMVFSEVDGAEGPEKTSDLATYNPELSKCYHGLSPEQRADLERRTAEENEAATGDKPAEQVADPEATRAEYVITSHPDVPTERRCRLARYGVEIVQRFMDKLQEKLGWTGHIMFGGIDHRGNLVAHE